MDRVLVEPNIETKGRYNRNGLTTPQGIIEDGVRISIERNKTLNPVRPDNVVRFSTAGAARDNSIKHPAPFHKDLPKYYINLLTDDGDTILDIFGGIMTTGLACNEIGNRNFIGFELNERYAEFGKKRIDGEDLDIYRVVQYDLEGNYIADYKNRNEASKATGIDDGDIMRTYNRTKFDSRGGFIWKLEPENVINQYDEEGNFIKSFNTPLEIEKHFDKPCVNNIKNILRGFKRNFTLFGYEWKLEKNNYGKI
jgi:hypothetical protein